MLRISIIWLGLVAHIFALSLVDVYRQKGLGTVENYLENALQNSKYWTKYLSDKDVSKGFYEFDTSVVFVDKKAKTMQLYRNIKNKQSKISDQEVIVGKMGDKQKEGDLKTPVGVYEITKRFVPKDTFYGPISFSLSYPNLMDTLNNKNGSGIWIHGFPLNNEKRDGRTKGCVVIKNDIIKKFDQDLGIEGKAIVIISESGDININKEEMATILSQLYKWRHAWLVSDLESYLSFYDENFRRFDGKNKDEFSQMKTAIFEKKERKVINFTNIAISPYPSTKEGEYFRIIFDEFYESPNYKFAGKKELYVKIENNKMLILAEK